MLYLDYKSYADKGVYVIDIEKCDLCGICINVCPTKTLSLIKALSTKEYDKKL